MDANDGTFRHWIDEGYPRPQLCRANWVSLNGTWEFALDPDERGLAENWYSVPVSRHDPFTMRITVPFPAGSELSGVCTDSPESVPDVVWYRRTITSAELIEAGKSGPFFVNFEAVDYEVDVWIDGQHVLNHCGGYSPFSVPLGTDGSTEQTIVVRARDDRFNTSQPRGKQAWRETPEGIWYHRSIGIWRDVWMEARPLVAIDSLNWQTDLTAATLKGEIGFTGPAPSGSTLTAEVFKNGSPVAKVEQTVAGRRTEMQFFIPALLNRMDWAEWLWAPDHPNLLDLRLTLNTKSDSDHVVSYVGLRTVELSSRYFLINRLPVYLRGVLDQGYWSESFFTAPSAGAIRKEVQLIRELGFNLSRIHERSADRRYLAWADRMGLLIWAECASTYRFDSEAVMAVISEWHDLVIRDRAHPSVIAWVPFNESWGVPEIASDPQQRAFVESVVALTRTLDQTRPVSANDGWEQLDTDIVTTHDYGTLGIELLVNYSDLAAVSETLNGAGPQGRRTLLERPWEDDRPVVLSEFGGISLGTSSEGAWAYDTVATPTEYEQRLAELFSAVQASPILAGFCYTQLTDTGLEMNGLCTDNREPKLPAEKIRAIVTDHSSHSRQIRPRLITDEATRRDKE